MTQNSTDPYKVSTERKSFAHQKAYWKLLDRSKVRTGHLVCTPIKNDVFVYVPNIFRLGLFLKKVYING